MEFREVFQLDDRFEADLIEEALRDEGIPYQLYANQETTLEPVFALQRSWGHVLVPAEERERALEVITAVLAARPVQEAEGLNQTPGNGAGSRDTDRDH